MRISLPEINALRDMDRPQLAKIAAELQVQPGPEGAASWPTNDSLRLAIIDRIVERALEQGTESIDTASKLGADHLAEAVLVHAHGVELGKKAEAFESEGRGSEAAIATERANRHFQVAASASSIAQAGLLAATLNAVAEGVAALGSDI